MRPSSGRPALPPELAAVPRVDARGRDLFRMHLRGDPDTGRDRAPFFFSSRSADSGGRFDLEAPRGTCYLADSRVGAWLETFRAAALVDARDVRRRGLTRTRCPRPAMLVDLTAPAAVSAGITLDAHAGEDRPRTWALADAADRVRAARGVQAWLRHDPAAAAHTIALFDAAGEHPPFGWTWRAETADPLDDAVLLGELAARGLGVADVPHDLPVVRPA